MKQLLIIALMFPLFFFSQEKIEGIITEATSDNKVFPLVGANVYWLNTSIGSITDIDGKFSIPYQPSYTKLVISFVGFKTDTLTITEPKYIEHRLEATSELDEITLTARQKATSKSYMSAQNVTIVSSAELLKAACCNLSESFETNPSIDVNFSDALTGTRQIKMLGLNQ